MKAGMSARGIFVAMLGALGVAGAGRAAIDDGRPLHMPIPPYPIAAYRNHESGCVVVSVTWDGAGKVSDCRLVHSSGSEALDRTTVAFVQGHWQSQEMAGKTITIPITFNLPSEGAPPPDLTLPVPPNPLPSGGPDRMVTLRITFGEDGRVTSAEVVKASGADVLDHAAVAFVKKKWTCLARAGQTVDVPIIYKAPAKK